MQRRFCFGTCFEIAVIVRYHVQPQRFQEGRNARYYGTTPRRISSSSIGTFAMSELSVQVPDSIMEGLREVVRTDGVSIEQFVSSAIAEKLSVFMSEDYLQERANRGSREKFLSVLDRAPE